jgi:Avidin family
MSLKGVWYNELGSTMELEIQGSNITGRYNTKVGDAEGWYSLTGRASGVHDKGEVVGFVVLWNNDRADTNSVTVWTGELLRDRLGSERIETMWLLTAGSSVEEEWRSTRTGKDVFARNPPTAERAELLSQTTAPSHPKGLLSRRP